MNDSALKPLSVIFPDACSKSLIKAGCKCTHKDVNVFIKDNGCVSLNNVQVFLLSIFKIFLIAGEFLYCWFQTFSLRWKLVTCSIFIKIAFLYFGKKNWAQLWLMLTFIPIVSIICKTVFNHEHVSCHWFLSIPH